MKLTRSTDKKVFSLTSFDPKDPNGEYFYIKAWFARLRPFQISEKLTLGMNKFFGEIKERFHQLVEVKFVGNCNYVLLTYIDTALTQKEATSLQTKQAKSTLGNAFMAAVKKQAGVCPPSPASQPPCQHLNLRKGMRYVFFDARTGNIAL